MPPKRAASAQSKAAAKPKTTKAAAAAAATTKKTTDAATRRTKTTTTAKKSSAATSNHKASEPAKSRKTKTTAEAATTAPASKKRKAASIDREEPIPQPKKARVTKPAAAPKPKPPKVVINTAPSTRLNIYVFGEGSSGELGLGPAKNAVDVKRPRLNPLLPADKIGVVQVAVGGMHCVALTHDNKILTWGVNDQGALGRNTTWEGGYKDIDDADKSDSDDDSDDDSGLNPHESTPTAIPAESFPDGTVFVEVVAGDSSSFALTDDGLVYGWGTFRVSDIFIPSLRT
jgi:regulator of chromosome condensation